LSGLAIPRIECVDDQANYGRFIAEALEKGFGVTLGNTLRRALLGYLPGAAVIRVRIEGIQHEFSTIPYVKEDTMEFLLNIKELRLKSLSGHPGKLTIEVEGEGRVCAADIKPSADFEIINPELYLATLDSPEAKLHAELEVELGEGYHPAESGDNLPIGTIPVDAIFTPVRKVNFSIEPIHVGQETSRERLCLEVWTDGTISPADAISRAAGILSEQLAPFIDYPRLSQMKPEEQLIRLSIPDEQYNMPVEQLNLSVRTMNCLRRASIATVGELISKGDKELLSLRNFGLKSRQELEERLNALELSLNPAAEEETTETEEAEPETEGTEAGQETDESQPPAEEETAGPEEAEPETEGTEEGQETDESQPQG